MFTENERSYLESARLARISTVSTDGQPDVTPVGFEFDGQNFYVGGFNNTRTRKYRNVQDGNDKVALVIDDLASVDPWQPRGVRVYGTAELVDREGYAGAGSYLKITPTVSWSWSIETSGTPGGTKKTVHKS
ncbi:MAG: PPOX class F420-dependent oxidoreductase [Dehalococcoidia bacterium]